MKFVVIFGLFLSQAAFSQPNYNIASIAEVSNAPTVTVDTCGKVDRSFNESRVLSECQMALSTSQVALQQKNLTILKVNACKPKECYVQGGGYPGAEGSINFIK